MSLPGTRKFLTSPKGAITLLVIAALAWGLTLKNQLSPSQKHLDAGIEYAHKGQGREAEQEWRTATTLDSNNAAAWNYLAEYYSDIHNWRASIEALHQLERLKPDTPHLQSRLARANMESGDEMEAYRIAEASLKVEPNDPDTILLFCSLLANTKENQRRLDLLRQAARLQPDNLKTQTLLAATLTDKRQFDEAKPLVEKLLQKDPSNLEASSLQGMILINTDSSPSGLKLAESDFLKTVDTPLYAPFAHFNLGKIYKRMGNQQEAAKHLESAAKMMPVKREVWFELSEVYAQKGDRVKSATARKQSEFLLDQENRIKSLEQKCVKNPADFDAHYELTRLFLSRSELHKADIHLEQLKTIRPNDPRTLQSIQQFAAASNLSKSADSNLSKSAASANSAFSPADNLNAAGSR